MLLWYIIKLVIALLQVIINEASNITSVAAALKKSFEAATGSNTSSECVAAIAKQTAETETWVQTYKTLCQNVNLTARDMM